MSDGQEKTVRSRTTLQIGFLILPIIISIVITTLIIMAVGSEPGEVFQAVW